MKTNQKIQVTMTEVEVGAWELMTNMNPPGDVSVASAQTRLLNRDYEVMERWVKTGFFTKVKFIPNPEREMGINGSVYKRFVKACKKDLAGLNNLSEESGRMYMEMLWQEANRPKRRLVMEAMSSCRTTIYSAQCNRFDCK